MKTKIISLGALFFLLSFGIAGAQQLAPAPPPNPTGQVLLPGTCIPKFFDQLPVAGQISVVNATPAPIGAIPSTPAYNIHIKEFKANILPVNAAIPAAKGCTALPAGTPSWVWGYLTDADVAAGGIRPSYLGPVVVAQRGTPATPTYTNELPYNGSNVLPLLPIDLTVHWANPLNAPCTPNPAVTGVWTNAICGTVYSGPEIPVAIHIHGGEVLPAHDGGPDAWFTQEPTAPGVPAGYIQKTGIGFPGNIYTYPNGQQESTIWFHDHALGITRLNVYAGLAGIYPIVDMGNPPPVNFPAFPQYDIPLIIQDRSFDTFGQIFYNLAANPQPNPTVHPFWIPEFIGDVILVNGKTWPNLNVEPRQYRFRLLNGSNARFYDLSMNKGLQFIAIATDGGYLQTAALTPNILIAPGERYEVIVDFSALAVGTKVLLKNAARMPFPGGARPTLNGTDTVMQFTVVTNSGAADTTIAAGNVLRAPTNPIQPIINGFTAPAVPPAQPAGNIVRQLTLNEILGPGGPLQLVINNSNYELTGLITGSLTPIGRETELPAVGDTEIWEIINTTADAHPMHTHLVTFQILDRTPYQAAKWINGYDAALLQKGILPGFGPPNTYNARNADGAIGGNPPINALLQLKSRTLPLPYEMGWKDTAVMYPGQVTRIVVRWAPTDAPLTGTACVAACGTGTNPACAPGCVPSAGTNTYPFNPTTLIGGVGYVWHCHIIDHEDNEMMRNYTVLDTRQPIQ